MLGPCMDPSWPGLTNTPNSGNDLPTSYVRKPRELAEGHMADEGQGQDSTGFPTLSLGLHHQKPRIQLPSPWSLRALPPHNDFGKVTADVSSGGMPTPGCSSRVPGLRGTRVTAPGVRSCTPRACPLLLSQSHWFCDCVRRLESKESSC